MEKIQPFVQVHSSGSNTGRYVSLTSSRGRSDIRGGVSILLYINSFITSGWVVIWSVDAVSSDVHRLLRLNSVDLASGDSGNILIRTYVSWWCRGIFVMVKVDSEDSL